MLWLFVKYATTAAIVVLVSEVAKRSDRLGGFIGALPIVTTLALIWLHLERQPAQKVANHAWFTFWYVLPTLPAFLAFPSLLSRFGFWPALGLATLITLGCFGLTIICLRPFGIDLI